MYTILPGSECISQVLSGIMEKMALLWKNILGKAKNPSIRDG